MHDVARRRRARVHPSRRAEHLGPRRCRGGGSGRAGSRRGTRGARASRRAPTAGRRRRGRAARSPFAGVGLEEALDDGAPHRAQLLRVALDRLDERRVLELEVEQLPEEVRDVADLAVLEHRARPARAPGPWPPRRPSPRRCRSAREGRARRPRTPGPRRGPCRGRRAAPARSRATRTRKSRTRRVLPMPGRAEDRHRARLLLVARERVRALELAHLGRAPHRASRGAR